MHTNSRSFEHRQNRKRDAKRVRVLSKEIVDHKKSSEFELPKPKTKKQRNSNLLSKDKSYGKIKIFVKKFNSELNKDSFSTLIFPGLDVTSNSKRSVKRDLSHMENEDPFAFVTILNDIRFINPSQACLNVSGEFIAANDKLKEFKEKWAHRKSEFVSQGRFNKIRLSTNEK